MRVTDSTGSTIAPPKKKPVIFFDERFMAARHEEGCHGKTIFTYFPVCKGLSNDDIGVARGTVILETRTEAGVKTSEFVNEELGRLS